MALSLNVRIVLRNKERDQTMNRGISKGKEANWTQTVPGKSWSVIFRLYGPQRGVFDGSFELNNIELVK